MQGKEPVWEPLLELAEEHVADFMWMFEVELEGGARPRPPVGPWMSTASIGSLTQRACWPSSWGTAPGLGAVTGSSTWW